jgi:hypothetical protein
MGSVADNIVHSGTCLITISVDQCLNSQPGPSSSYSSLSLSLSLSLYIYIYIYISLSVCVVNTIFALILLSVPQLCYLVSWETH